VDPNDQAGGGRRGRQIKIEFEGNTSDFRKRDIGAVFFRGRGDRGGAECDEEKWKMAESHVNVAGLDLEGWSLSFPP
jgi:hypothetical protein